MPYTSIPTEIEAVQIPNDYAEFNANGSFDSFVSDEVRDIDFCYAIDCLKERRSLRLKEIRS